MRFSQERSTALSCNERKIQRSPSGSKGLAWARFPAKTPQSREGTNGQEIPVSETSKLPTGANAEQPTVLNGASSTQANLEHEPPDRTTIPVPATATAVPTVADATASTSSHEAFEKTKHLFEDCLRAETQRVLSTLEEHRASDR